jgi:hypothetical protein
MTALNEELLFALRSPQSQTLALLVCALDEALRDPSFDASQRELVGRLLQSRSVPAPVVAAAETRVNPTAGQPALDANDDFSDVLEWIQQTERTQPARPKLTLVGSAAA